jgi:hypothetical protein
MVSGILLIKHLPKIELPIQIINYLGILVTGFSSIYLTVRGFDNYLKWRELRKFNSSNNNANKLIKIEEIVNKLSSMKITNSLIIQSELSDWNYNGTWGVINGNILSVENSDNGGVYKYGYSWSNYSFSFDFMLINSHAGWIVRSNEDGKQIMINISTNGLRCHCKESRSAKYKLINEYSISRNILNEWHHLETIVNGLNCQVLLDRAVIYSFAMPNDYAIGTVGFRCHSGESAQFRNIRVVADLI